MTLNLYPWIITKDENEKVMNVARSRIFQISISTYSEKLLQDYEDNVLQKSKTPQPVYMNYKQDRKFILKRN